jgi:cysteinyl-tRNA synthetase
MTIRLRDTLSGETRDLEPIEPGHVRIYSCGPTVYGPTHIGNFRSFLFADVLVRYLRYRGLRVTWVMNVTDVDDRSSRNANAAGQTIGELTGRWLDRFKVDIAAVRMTAAGRPAPGNGLHRRHGPIVGRSSRRATPTGPRTARSSSGSARGRHTAGSPPGPGAAPGRRARRGRRLRQGRRPGLRALEGPEARRAVVGHVDRTGPPGLAHRVLGDGMKSPRRVVRHPHGGIDLIFPHHEDEIAQSEACDGKTFVRTWLHCDHLRLGGTKMARRVGNIARVADSAR